MTNTSSDSLNQNTPKLAGRAWHSTLANGLMCLLGCLLLALGMTMFLQPNQIAGGGTPGIAILICHLTGLSAGTVMILINLPLLVLGGYYLGQGFVWRTMLAVIAISALVDLFHEVLQAPVGSHTPVLAAMIGGAGIGLGVGLILKGGASAGGPTIIARIVATHSPIRPGRLLLLMDALIVCMSAFVFGSVEPALLSLLSVFVTGRCVDFVLSKNAVTTIPIPSISCSGSPTH